MARVFGHPVTWLVVLVLIFFYKEVLFGRVFSPADLLFDFQPWATGRPASYQHPSNALRVDDAFIFFPRREQIASDVAKFGIPLWQDHNFAGTPNTFSINFLGAFLYPPMWAYLVLPAGVANTLLHIPIPLIAALSMYLLLGRLTRRRPVRLLGAIAWGLNGYFIVWLSAFFLPLALAVMPLLLYLAVRFLDDGRLWAGLTYALLLAWTFFLGYPPAEVVLLTILAIYVAVWLAVDIRGRARRLLAFAALSGLALGLAGLPIVTGISELSGLVGSRRVLTILPIKDVQTFLFPNIFGNPTALDWRAPQGNYCEYIAYFGSIPLILAVAGGIAWIARRDFRIPILSAAVVTGVIALGLAYAVWPLSLLQRLPIFGDVSPSRWHIGVVFAGVILAVYALEALLSGQLSARTLGSAAALVLLGAAVILVAHRRDLVGPDHFIRNDELLRAALIIVSAAALLALLRARSSIVVAGLSVILAIDLITFGTGFNPAIRAADFYPETPALHYLQAHAAGYRVVVARESGLLWPGDVLPVYGIDSATGYDHFRDASYVAMLGSNMSQAERDFWQQTGYVTLGQSLDLNSSVLNLLSVKYAFYPDQASDFSPPGSDHWQLVYVGPDGRVLENLQALPRQFTVPVAGGTPDPIQHTAQRPDRDQLVAQGPGLLVWSKPFSKDWKITIDGHAATASSFNGYFLSVQLPGGSHQVALDYAPADYLVGALISALSLLIVGLLGLRLWRRSRA
jgi:Bacterial membrane protein YfhO